jgi:hypothetical protein
MTYNVFVDDNYHHGDEDARYRLGEFETIDAAVEACRKIVDRCLEEDYQPDMTAEALWSRYTMFGDDPYIVGEDPLPFSAWDYARTRAADICGGGKRPFVTPPSHPSS